VTPDPRLSVPDIVREDRPDGAIVLHNRTPLPDPLPDVLDRFDRWVADAPDAPFVSERRGEEVLTIGYGAIDRMSDALAAFLRTKGLTKSSTIAVVGGASVTHAAVKLAALKAGIAHAPLSPALLASEHGRGRLAAMLAGAQPSCLIDLTGDLPGALASLVPSRLDRDAIESAMGNDTGFARQVTRPEDLAAIYFTSGSTGEPKGVAVTRRMIASCQAAYAAHWPFLADHRPALIDWLPWHHVFGGLDNFHKMIWNGGAYHVETPPGPENINAMAARIRTVRPTIHINVPYGIDLLLDHLDTDPETRAALFDRLDLVFFAGAGMGARTWERLQDAVTAGPHGPAGPPLVLSGYGSTEAGSTMCLGFEAARDTAEIGLPLPGHALCLAPVDDAHEIRFRGPNVAPRYLGPDGPFPLPLDEDGFLRTGDLGRATHAGTPERGLSFDGRLAEDFKLTNGSRVKTGALRHALLAACAPDLQDVAIAGAGHDRIALILFPTPDAPRDGIATRLKRALETHNAAHPGSTTAIYRAVLTDVPPDRSAGEINDKGHLVQARCLANRADLVERLYREPPDPDILCPEAHDGAETKKETGT
jgi:feruloyl-CoA synthase